MDKKTIRSIAKATGTIIAAAFVAEAISAVIESAYPPAPASAVRGTLLATGLVGAGFLADPKDAAYSVACLAAGAGYAAAVLARGAVHAIAATPSPRQMR